MFPGHLPRLRDAFAEAHGGLDSRYAAGSSLTCFNSVDGRENWAGHAVITSSDPIGYREDLATWVIAGRRDQHRNAIEDEGGNRHHE